MEKKERVAIILPPSPHLCDERVFPQLGPLRVAGALIQAGISVDVIDCSGFSNYTNIVERYISSNDTEIFAIGCTTSQLKNAEDIIKTIRNHKPEAKVILGGVHVTTACSSYKRERKLGKPSRGTKAFMHLLTLADTVVSGDGERAVQLAIRPDSPPLIDADDPNSPLFLQTGEVADFDFPKRELIDLDSYHYWIDGVRSTSIVGQLGCPFQCIADDVTIGTSSGLYYPDEIARNEINICPEGHIHTLGQFQGGRIVYNGHRDTIKITLKNALGISLTPDHPILAVDKEKLIWKSADSLKEDDWIALSADQNEITEECDLKPPSFTPQRTARIKRKVQCPAKLTEEVAWITGLLIADGSIPSDGRPAIHFAVKPRVQEKLIECIRFCFGDIPAVLAPFSTTDKIKQIWLHSPIVRGFFEQSLGVDCKDKLRVPYLIRKSPKRIVRAFIDGLLGGDGYFKSRGHPYIGTKSHLFAQELAQLAIWCGWGATINFSMPDPKGHRHARVIICEDRCWTREHGGKPCLTVAIPLNNRRIYRSRKSGLLHWRTATGHGPGALRSSVRELEPKHPLIVGKYIYCQVKTIIPSGIKRVFDIGVPGAEQFGAGAITVHNCTFCGARLSPSFRRMRLRPIDNLIAEVEHIYDTWGIRGLFHLDDELNASKTLMNYLAEFRKLQDRLGVEFRCRGFLKSELITKEQAKALYDTGFRNVLIGFENAHPRILANIRKMATVEDNTRAMDICQNAGLKVKALLSIGHAAESFESIEATKDWILKVRPDDFDLTIVQPYLSTPIFDEAVEFDGKPGIWVYTAKSGDRLYMEDISFSENPLYYKGIPGDYKAFVYTDYISSEDLVRMRDETEKELRAKLNIPFYKITPQSNLEASMGQLPGYIYRSS